MVCRGVSWCGQSRSIGLSIDMHVDMRPGMHVDMHTGINVDMHTGMHVDRHKCRHAHRHSLGVRYSSRRSKGVSARLYTCARHAIGDAEIKKMPRCLFRDCRMAA